MDCHDARLCFDAVLRLIARPAFRRSAYALAYMAIQKGMLESVERDRRSKRLGGILMEQLKRMLVCTLTPPGVTQALDRHVLATHGTDTMVETAKELAAIKGKVIVLTGALNPARFQGSDAVFNVGCAVAAVQTLPDGVYIAMNGRVWDPAKVRKNRDANRFEEASG